MTPRQRGELVYIAIAIIPALATSVLAVWWLFG